MRNLIAEKQNVLLRESFNCYEMRRQLVDGEINFVFAIQRKELSLALKVKLKRVSRIKRSHLTLKISQEKHIFMQKNR